MLLQAFFEVNLWVILAKEHALTTLIAKVLVEKVWPFILTVVSPMGFLVGALSLAIELHVWDLLAYGVETALTIFSLLGINRLLPNVQSGLIRLQLILVVIDRYVRGRILLRLLILLVQLKNTLVRVIMFVPLLHDPSKVEIGQLLLIVSSQVLRGWALRDHKTRFGALLGNYELFLGLANAVLFEKLALGEVTKFCLDFRGIPFLKDRHSTWLSDQNILQLIRCLWRWRC